MVAVYSHVTNRDRRRTQCRGRLSRFWGAGGKVYKLFSPSNSIVVFHPNEFPVAPRLSSPKNQPMNSIGKIGGAYCNLKSIEANHERLSRADFTSTLKTFNILTVKTKFMHMLVWCP